jgi:PAS domain S-box-containing protein
MISRLKEGEIREAVDESSQLYRTLVNQLPNPILIHIGGKVVFANALVTELTGLGPDQIRGREIAEVLTDPTDEKNRRAIAHLLADPDVTGEEFEVVTPRKKVVIRHFLFRNSRIRYGGEEAILTILIDITERKHLEKYIVGRVIASEEKSRKQFAADLHDDLGPVLSSIMLHLGLLGQTSDPEKAAEILHVSMKLLTEAIAKMRLISNNLMPRLIENFGLESALHSFVSTIPQEGPLKVSLVSNLGNRRFQKHTELHFYRIICELVNNTIKHAGATVATIRLRLTGSRLMMRYTDNGRGYDMDEIAKKPGGLGMTNILQRADLIGAKILFKRVKGKTIVELIREV